MTLSPKLLEKVERAYNKALKYISYRPRSEKEITDFLTKKKFDKDIITTILERLKELNLLNDEEFVRWWIEQRQTYRPKSKRIIKQELKLKGISQDLIDEIVEKDSKDDFETALELFKKNQRKFENYKNQEYLKKVSEFLGRRGFNWDIIKKVLEKRKEDIL